MVTEFENCPHFDRIQDIESDLVPNKKLEVKAKQLQRELEEMKIEIHDMKRDIEQLQKELKVLKKNQSTFDTFKKGTPERLAKTILFIVLITSVLIFGAAMYDQRFHHNLQKTEKVK